jgi:hypothetical protein
MGSRKEYYRQYNAKRYTSPEARAKELQRMRDKYHTLVKFQRLARKMKLVNMLGGKCQRCGYSRCAAALDFHHRDRKEKSRTLSHLLAANVPANFKKAVIEARKCDLLCSNCHRELTYPEHEIRAAGKLIEVNF